MLVKSWEEGDRPALTTRARSQAPDARQAIVNALSSQDWATHAYVVCDWTGRIAFIDGDGQSQDGPALDKAKPVMYLQVIKAMPQLGGSVIIEERIDIDDVFGGTAITAANLADILVYMKEELLAKDAQVRKEVQ